MLSRLHPLYVTRPTHQNALVRVTPLIRLIRQLHSTVLTDVAVDVEVKVHGHDSHCLLCTLHRSDSFTATGTLWGVHTVVVIHAINLIIHVHGEWHSVQTLIAHTAPEAAGMVAGTHRLKDLEIKENYFISKGSFDDVLK